ncbi:hypothetical protein [Burkholderia sp. Bp9143]|uniref:hypothetical protein n=1 Tax=Burkholderia sp. Bp9143 TaxID=2184574 RepID=UPI000F58F457|nr:hypothetical protein [Burkholderia sp. Bp9143]
MKVHEGIRSATPSPLPPAPTLAFHRWLATPAYPVVTFILKRSIPMVTATRLGKPIRVGPATIMSG